MSSPPDHIDLTPANRTLLSADVAEQLSELILSDQLKSGQRLPSERALAEQLQVSRIVIREALSVLAERGLIEVRAGSGAFVVPMEAEAVTRPLDLYLKRNNVDYAHLFELRHALEPAIAALAARRLGAETAEKLAENLAVSQHVATVIAGAAGAGLAEALRDFALLDLEFHQLLSAASGNPLFRLVLQPLIARELELRREGARLPGTAEQAVRDHAAILQAVSGSDAEGAAAAMRAHLRKVEAWLVETDGLREREYGPEENND